MARLRTRVTQAVALLTAGALSLWAGFAQAHDGDHTPRVFAQIDTATIRGNDVVFDLVVTGLDPDQPVAIRSLSADGAPVVALLEPQPIPFSQDVVITSRLRFDGPPPGIFTLTLDFGALGVGGVVVIPEVTETVEPDATQEER